MLDQSRLICMCIYKGYSVLDLSIGADAIVGRVAGVAHEMKRTAHCKKITGIYKKIFKTHQKVSMSKQKFPKCQKMCIYTYICIYIYIYIYIYI